MKKLLLTQFDLHHRLYNNVLDGFNDAESNRRLHGNKNINHVKYLAGHLLNAQYGLAMVAGMNPEAKWNDLFAPMGQSKAEDGIPYPDIEEIKAEWNGMHEKIRAGLEKLTPRRVGQTASATNRSIFFFVWRFLGFSQPPSGLSYWANRNIEEGFR